MELNSVVGPGAPLKDAPTQGTESATKAALGQGMALDRAPNRAIPSKEMDRSSVGVPHGIVPDRDALAEEVRKGANPPKGIAKPKQSELGTSSGTQLSCGGTRASSSSGISKDTGAKVPHTQMPWKVVTGGWRGAQGVNPSASPSTSGPPTGVRVSGQVSHPTKRKQSSAKRKRAIRRQQPVSGAPPTEAPGTSKRAREVSSESPGTSGVSKKGKSQGDSYREALTGVKMAVISDDHPTSEIPAGMLNTLRGVMWEMLEATPDPLPHVSTGRWISGAVHFTCVGEVAAQWLCRLNGMTVGEVKLRVVNARDLPKPVKMAWKSKNTWCVDTPKVLNMLQRFNPALKTAEWKVVDTLIEEGHVRRIVYMDKVSAEVIKTGNYYLQAGLDRSSFKLLDDTTGKTGGPAREGSAKLTPIAAPQEPEGAPADPHTGETAAERTASPTSSVRTDELLGGMDVMSLALSPRSGEMEDELKDPGRDH